MEGNVFLEGEKVVKVTSKSAAQKQKAAAEKLDTADPRQRHTVYGTRFQEKGDRIEITQPYGGVALSQLTDAIWMLKRGKLASNQDTLKYKKRIDAFRPYIPKILAEFERLIAFLPRIHQEGLTHSDLQPENMVWNGEHLRLIDWGQATFKGDPKFEKETEADLEGLTDIFDDFKADIAFAEGLGASAST